ncbi:hypothetical protein DICPUDRAFT_34025 [Dictyostelium purpureum]|uniref:Expansin-like EG45 domain-containing protein n=1 Tax=Dictyostelium purpureum TaxID=5786 RepID=F0ZLY8_DICPU|nr:uncharacterized protein DICPUDRAFT_34025 [Dictyostelium purpureum]EGC35051.1 hypothetical protein DICPUDRAFT_34025 [Dictyostelium purpureum]|eukprot:XP_003288419.1 hypothetical protein DICPUDRAFT_34025 [Dictyostelium purpureum]
MRLLLQLILIFTILFSIANAIDNVPLTLCMSGRAQGTESLNKSGSCEYGPYNGPTGPGTLTATLNEYFYSSGVKCGDCFEISGPKGKTVVRVVNFCSAGTCPSEKPLFMLTPDAFSEISNDPLSVIYDAGFRKVSCDANAAPIKAQVSEDSSKYYVKLLIFNNNLGIKDVTIKSKSMKTAVPMVRQNSAQFVWSEAGKEMTFPATVTVSSQYGGSVTLELKSLDKDVLKFSDNFVVPKGLIKKAPETCSLSASPLTIYQNGLTEGWNYWSSRSYSAINTTDTSMHSNGSTSSLSIILLGSSSSLTLARSGDFDTAYFTGIKFNIRSNTTLEGFRVYFPSEESKFWTPKTPISTSWTTYTVPFSALKHKSIESAITFANTDNVNAYIHIDNIFFIASPHASTSGYASSNDTNGTGNLATTAGTSATGAATAAATTGGVATGSTESTSTATTGGKGHTTGTVTPLTSTGRTTSNPTTASSIGGNSDSETSDEHHSSSSTVQISLLLISAILAFISL